MAPVHTAVRADFSNERKGRRSHCLFPSFFPHTPLVDALRAAVVKYVTAVSSGRVARVVTTWRSTTKYMVGPAPGERSSAPLAMPIQRPTLLRPVRVCQAARRKRTHAPRFESLKHFARASYLEIYIKTGKSSVLR